MAYNFTQGAPLYSSPVGTKYTNPNTGTTYISSPNGWQQISTGKNSIGSNATSNKQSNPIVFDSGTGNSAEGTTTRASQAYLDEFQSRIDQYTNNLIALAQGDYDFASKYLEKEYKTALGTDPDKTEFLKSVASDLENKVGRIEYDYQTNTYRATQNKDIALRRLAEDEKIAKDALATESEIAKEQQMGELNQKGLVTGARSATEGLGGKFVRRLDEEIINKQKAIERASQRTSGDTLLGYEREMQDSATGARRNVLDTQTGYQKQTEENKLALERAKKNALQNKALYEKELYGGTWNTA